MMLTDRIYGDLQRAVKDHDTLRSSALRLTLAAIHNAGIDKRTVLAKRGMEGEGGPAERLLDDEEVLRVLRREIRMCEEARDAFQKGGRDAQAEKESAEISILKTYLPQELSDDEIRAKARQLIAELAAGPRDFGRIMGQLMRAFQGQADGVRVRTIVESMLRTHEKREEQ